MTSERLVKCRFTNKKKQRQQGYRFKRMCWKKTKNAVF